MLVGWSRRNRERDQELRAYWKRRNEWLATLTPERRAEEKASDLREAKQSIAITAVVFGLVCIFVGLLIVFAHRQPRAPSTSEQLTEKGKKS